MTSSSVLVVDALLTALRGPLSPEDTLRLASVADEATFVSALMREHLALGGLHPERVLVATLHLPLSSSGLARVLWRLPMTDPMVLDLALCHPGISQEQKLGLVLQALKADCGPVREHLTGHPDMQVRFMVRVAQGLRGVTRSSWATVMVAQGLLGRPDAYEVFCALVGDEPVPWDDVLEAELEAERVLELVEQSLLLCPGGVGAAGADGG